MGRAERPDMAGWTVRSAARSVSVAIKVPAGTRIPRWGGRTIRHKIA